MKQTISILTLAAALIFPLTSSVKAEPDAKLTKTEAQAIALGRAKGGTVKSSELEKEHGVLVWSFDITTPDTKDITEVQVDANTGKIVSVEIETPEHEAKEAKEEAAEKK